MVTIKFFLSVILALAMFACSSKTASKEPDLAAILGAYGGSEGPTCFSPCQNDIVIDKTAEGVAADSNQTTSQVISCIEGLLGYCPGKLECRCPDGDANCAYGSCLEASSPYPTCKTDVECADFQSCQSGVCVSGCASDQECSSEEKGDANTCYKRVCRIPCSTSEESCPKGTTCSNVGTNQALCMPMVTRSDDIGERATGTFELSPSFLSLSKGVDNATFTIVNKSLLAETFIIKKKSYTKSSGGTTEIIKTNPLSWISINGKVDNELKITVGSEGEESGRADIVLTGIDNPDLKMWSGILEITNEKMGTQELSLNFASGADGHWTGKIYYFANFGTANLEGWMADKNNRDKAYQLHNALIGKWITFLDSNYLKDSYEEFQAVFSATTSGSWQWNSTKRKCAELGKEACFLKEKGIGSYSHDLGEQPVPTGMISLPFAINLKQKPLENLTYLGRIVSADTLQYAGNPELTVAFEKDPVTVCSETVGGTCIAKLKDFRAEVVVGGRYYTDISNELLLDLKSSDFAGKGYKEDPLGNFCILNAKPGSPNAFVLARVPWLPPGFTNHTIQDRENPLLRYVYECRDRAIPFEGYSGKNASFSLANPVPNAKSRERVLTLVDGAMIHQDSMFIFFKEEVGPIIPGRSEGFASYGVIQMRRNSAIALKGADYQGVIQKETRSIDNNLPLTSCSQSLLEDIFPDQGMTDLAAVTKAGKTDTLVTTLITGQNPEIQAIPGSMYIMPGDGESVHYYCEDTGLFDGGKGAAANSVNVGNGTIRSTGIRCPSGSRVVYFSLTDPSLEDLAGDPCQVTYEEDADDPLCEIKPETPEEKAMRIEAENNATAQGLPKPEIQMGSQQCWPGIKTKGKCQGRLQELMVMNSYREVQWHCTDSQSEICDYDPINDPNRLDLTAGKKFYKKPQGGGKQFLSLLNEITEAFRYKTRFRNRNTGGSIGFTPVICAPGSTGTPYCYDPEKIEAVQERVACTQAIYSDAYDTLSKDHKKMLVGYLDKNFSFYTSPTGFTEDGFERMYAELLIMLGDDKYTESFASRFDLAQSSIRRFEGSLFEPGGITLSGGAGNEMYVLYMAAQYYQMALDRFYSLSGLVDLSLSRTKLNSNDGFIDLDSVASYFEKLIRAATQKARTWSQISVRYQSFNEPDLARRVIERAYNAAYLESILLSEIMKKVVKTVSPQEVPQVNKIIDNAQLRYEVALLEMRDVYGDISDDVRLFGFAPEYIPFPALDEADTNAFDKSLAAARHKADVAATKEKVALADSRSYETDAAEFQAELTRIQINYEEELADLCGTFEGESEADPSSSKIYPSIRKYAHLNAGASKMGDPCGFAGNGQIYNALMELKISALELEKTKKKMENTIEEAKTERDRVQKACAWIGEDVRRKCQVAYQMAIVECDDMLGDAATQFTEFEDEKYRLNEAIIAEEFAVTTLDRWTNYAGTVAGLSKCTPPSPMAGAGDCPSGLAALATFSVAGAISNTMATGLEAAIMGEQIRLNDLEKDQLSWELTEACQGYSAESATCFPNCSEAELAAIKDTDVGKVADVECSANELGIECDMAEVDSAAKIKTIMLRMKELEIEALKGQYNVQLASSKYEKLKNEAKRLENEQSEIEQLTIDVAAARNNPNIRIYKNDAIITADRTFQRAVKDAYKTTKVYEYYTSQGYEWLKSLGLVRMVSAGDYSLESYLDQLEDFFIEFEEGYGNPDLRVAIISLRDHIWSSRVPYYKLSDSGQSIPMSHKERVELFRKILTDPNWLDGNGYIVVPFSTAVLKKVSPFTFNHKIKYIEVEIKGSNVGDNEGRVYIKQKGTGTVLTIEGDKQYYSFPERLAVINPYFNGQRYRVFASESVFNNKRFADRPFLNSNSELIINMVDETANKDIDLASIDDIVLYYYYTDFTKDIALSIKN